MSTWSSVMPSVRSSCTSSTRRAIASLNGDVLISCEPMWKSTPLIWRPVRVAASRSSARASPIPTPNLFCLRPVEMYGCVSGSTSGFTRSANFTRAPAPRATSSSTTSSSADSTLKQPMPATIAAAISSRVLPTPENTTFAGSPPARCHRYSSPIDTMSAPAPSSTSTASTPRVEQAFTA